MTITPNITSRDNRQLIECHLTNIRTAILALQRANQSHQHHIIAAIAPPIMLDIQAILNLARELLEQPTPRKDPRPCSHTQAKSSSPPPSSASPSA